MNRSKRIRGLMKKVIAVTLGITMAFGALCLPNSIVKDSFTTASAATVEVDNCKFTFSFTERTGVKTIKINNVEFTGDTVEIPSTITYEDVTYSVTEINENFLENNKQVKKVIVPDSVTYIDDDFLQYSSVEKIILSNKLEHLGNSFAANCFSLTSIECTYIDVPLSEIGSCIMQNCHKIKNEKGAVCLANWLISYRPADDITEVKICDLGNNGTKLDRMADDSLWVGGKNLTTVDLEGITHIGRSNFSGFGKLKYITNAENVIDVETSAFSKTPWLNEAKENHIAKLGSVLMYYKTDDTVIDLTSYPLIGITSVATQAFADCPNATTLFCNSDCILNNKCFYMNYDQSGEHESLADPMPKVPTYKIKDIYLDGKKLEFNKNDPEMSYWIKTNYYVLRGTEWLKINCEKKAELLFEQLDLPFYGVNNDKVGTLTPTEEFYAALKLHDYLSTYNYDLADQNEAALDAFLCGGLVNCAGYADMTAFLLECAGVKCLVLSSGIEGNHAWNEIKIGDDWYEWDGGWDEQYSHTYGWLGLSSEWVARASSTIHNVKDTKASWHNFEKLDRIIAERLMGDVNNDTWRNENDYKLLWSYLKHEDVEIDKTAADINYDGVIDVTDGVLLENFVTGHAVDPDNFPTDGLAPGFKVAFVNGEDYDNIQYAYTDRDGYIVLPDDTFEPPAGKKLSYDIGKVGQKVKIHNPYQVIQTKWIDATEPDYSEPDSSNKDNSSSKPDSSKPDSSSMSDSSNTKEDKYKLGDVNGDGTIDIEDAVAIIQHINGVTPLKADEEKRADVSKDNNIDIDDAVTIISYINGNSTF